MAVSQIAISMRNMIIHPRNFSHIRHPRFEHTNFGAWWWWWWWWMMNDEWCMVNGEWWMVNDEWWTIVDDDDDDDDFLRWFNNILGTDQKFKLRVECNLEQKNAHKCPVLVPRLPISTSRTNTTLIRGLDYCNLKKKVNSNPYLGAGSTTMFGWYPL